MRVNVFCRSSETAVLAAAAAWIDRSLRQETLGFSCDCCELTLTADARLDEGMLYVDDPFDDLGLDDDSSEGSHADCIAEQSAAASMSQGSKCDAPVADILVQQDTTGATFCWPAALTICNFLLERKDWIRGKQVRYPIAS